MLSNKPEYLSAYNQHGNIEIAKVERGVLLDRMRQISLEKGDAPFAVPVFYAILRDYERRIRIVRRSPTKYEDSNLWCVSSAGHIQWRENTEDTIRREFNEELAIGVRIAEEEKHYHDLLEDTKKLKHSAVIREIHYNPWWGSIKVNKDDDRVWYKRVQMTIMAGVYNEEFDLDQGDGESVEERRIKPEELIKELEEHPFEGPTRIHSHDLRNIIENPEFLEFILQ